MEVVAYANATVASASLYSAPMNDGPPARFSGAILQLPGRSPRNPPRPPALTGQGAGAHCCWGCSGALTHSFGRDASCSNTAPRVPSPERSTQRDRELFNAAPAYRAAAP